MRKLLFVLISLAACDTPEDTPKRETLADAAVSGVGALGGTTGGAPPSGGTAGGLMGGGTFGGTMSPDAGGAKPSSDAGPASGGGGMQAGQDAAAEPGPIDAEVSDAGSADALPHFSFFVTSLASLRELSGSQSGFGGDLRFGETGDGAGLRGADKICATIAEMSMPGASAKQWRAFLSTSSVDAKDRVGQGPWYDRKGRLVAQTLSDLLNERPEGADPAIVNDFPNEFGVPNHDPDGTGNVDNHDMLTGTNAKGTLFCPDDPARCTCNDWTSAAADNTKPPRVGHSWPRFTGGGFGGGGFGGGFPGGAGPGGGDGSMANWMSALNEAGCAPGVSLIEMGPPQQSNPTVGSGGGYGGFYCFALTP